jgi:hypothetical protein
MANVKNKSIVKSRYARERTKSDMDNGYRGTPRGMIVYCSRDGNFKFGYSACHKDDSFEYKEANKVALDKYFKDPISLSLEDSSLLPQVLMLVPTYLRPLVAKAYAYELARYYVNQVGNRVYDKVNGVV